jgi:hypothetical protein
MKHKVNRILLSVAVVIVFSISGKSQASSYPENVGDISFNPKLDDPSFKICNEKYVFQYYNFSKGLQYKGEKVKIDQFFREHFTYKKMAGETGSLTIRFIVNCEGKTGLFRVQEMDSHYNAKKFNAELRDQLLLLTRQLDGWVAAQWQGKKVDYYQYLTFRLIDGKLIEIMP